MRSKAKTSRTARSRRAPATTRRSVPRAATPIARTSGAARPACEAGDQIDAAVAGLAGIAPQDELEGMMAAQLTAAHAAAMTCYRDAGREGSFERRRDCLNQAVKLTRAFLALHTALQRRRDPWAHARPRRTDEAKPAKQPCEAARSAPATAQPNSAKQPSNTLASAESVKQPATLSAAAAASARVADPAAAPSAKSAKQPSTEAPILPSPPTPRGTPAVPFARAAPAGTAGKFPQQPGLSAPALALSTATLGAYRAPGVSRALAAALMEGTSLRLAE